jgi:hypothetical protein
VIPAPFEPVDSLLGCIGNIHCRRPSEKIVPKSSCVLDIHFVPIGRICRDATDLHQGMLDALITHRLKPVSLYQALCFNKDNQPFQRHQPFVAAGHAFGSAERDRFQGPYDERVSLELSNLRQFASGGTSPYLIMLATNPTSVDQGCFEGEVLNQALKSLMPPFSW